MRNGPSFRRTLWLTERVPTECRLSSADVAFLLAEHRGHLELLPTGRRQRYRLRPLGHVGVIVAPSCRLVIRPKIPVRNLFHLLDPTAPLPATPDQVTPAPDGDLLDFLAGQLAQRLTERATTGLHREYAERAEQGPFLHGRLDVSAQLRDAPGRKEQLHSHYDDFTADVPCNQVPKATAEWLIRSPLLGETVRGALLQALQGFDGVRSVPLDLSAAMMDAVREEYRPLLDLCRLLAEGLRPGNAAGAMPGPAFLLDMERVFERYVTRGVEEALAGRDRLVLSVQPLYVANRPMPGQPDVEMRPDVMIHRDGRAALLVDAKWKRLPKNALVTSDLYQMLAYGTALGVPRAALVYPGRRDRVWNYELGDRPVRVEVHVLRVAGDVEACARSLRRLGQRLRRGLALPRAADNTD
jgi:5-methylcytosine-specific restriction enzyme subunit McrC